MKNYSIIIMAVTIFIQLNAKSTIALETNSPPIVPIKKDLQNYFYRLTSIAKDTAGNKIELLQNLLIDFPDIESAYITILEQFLLQNEHSNAIKYFKIMSNRKRYRQNSYWMLAKLYSLFHSAFSIDSAKVYYSKALQSGKASYHFLKDFMDFNYRNTGNFTLASELDNLNLNSNQDKFIEAVSKYNLLKFDEAYDILKNLTSELPDNMLISFLSGFCQYRLNHIDAAESIWKSGLTISQRIGDLKAESQFLTRLGVLMWYRKFEYDEANSLLNSAQNIAIQTLNMTQLQQILGNKGAMYNRLEKFDAAISQFNEALKYAIPLGAYQSAVSWYRGKGYAAFFRDLISEALESYDRSEKLARRIGDQLYLIQAKLNRAVVLTYMKQDSMASREYLECFQLAKKNNLFSLQNRALAGYAETLFNRKKYAEARNIYLGILNSEHAPSNLIEKWDYYWHAGEIFKEEKQFGDAKINFERALENAQKANSKYYSAYSLLRLADIETLQGNYKPAIKLYNDELIKKVAQNDVELNLELNIGLGNAYRGQGDLLNAIAFYNTAADILEHSTQQLKVQQFRIGFFGKGFEVYRQLAQCFYKLFEQSGKNAYLDSIYLNLELGQSRALRELRLKKVASGIDSTRIKNYASYQKSYQEYKLAMDKLKKIQRHWRFSNWMTDSLDRQIELERYSLMARRLRLLDELSVPSSEINERAPSLAVIRKQLKQRDMALLFYHISDENSFVLVIQNTQIQLVPIEVNRSVLAPAINSLLVPFYEFAGNSKKILFHAKIAYRLCQKLFKPIVDKVALPNRIVIIADYDLMGFPFELLLSQPPEKSSYTPFDKPTYADYFLLHDHAFTYMPSSIFLRRGNQAYLEKPKILLFANPFGNEPERFSPLPYSENEAENIHRIYDKIKIVKRENAAKNVYENEAQNYDILHFATHAVVDKSFDAYSGLVLAASEKVNDDGLLMGYEISPQKLKSALVTLSACETGQGKMVAGEGVLGLSRLFLGAGVQSVLMTMWKVQDKFASEFMPNFYDNLLNKNMSKDKALQESRQYIINQWKELGPNGYYQHPMFWATFCLYGDPGERAKQNLTIIFATTLITLAVVVAIIIRRKAFSN